MGLSESMQFNQNTSDNLNPSDSTIPILKKTDENMTLEEGASIISSQNVTHSFIVGHSVNGKLGVANGVDGQQITLGDSRSTSSVIRVVNPNDTFKERFYGETFKDASQVNTAYWDTTDRKLKMSSSTKHSKAYNTIATSSTIFTDLKTVIQTTVNSTETKYSTNDLIKYFLSADGGTNWQEATLNTELTFDYPGQDLRFRIIFLGQGGSSTYIENLQVSYKI